MIENQSRKKGRRRKEKRKRNEEKKSYSPSLASKLTFLARRVISWSAILTSSWMRRNDENTGVLVNSCQLGNNDVVDASWRKYVVRPLHFFPSLSLPLPLSSSLFAKSHWKPTYRDFLRDNSSAICEETLKPFFTGRSRVIISLFCILRQFHCCGRMDARNTWEEDFRHEFRRHVPNDICVKSWF